jgi:hypothetical protein
MFLKNEEFPNLIPILAIFIVGLLLTLPAIVNGSLNGHDFPLHLRWTKYFVAQFWSGDLYPRWLMEMNAGFGSPTFFYYPPIPYYVASLFKPLFANNTGGWYPLVSSALVALIASGWAAYLWLRTISHRNAALISSIIYMALPYHLAIDLYTRFSFAEYWTFVWIPLILYFTQKIIVGHKANSIGLAVSYALLIMTHLPTLVIFAGFPFLYIFFTTVGRQRIKALIYMVAALVLGLGLSAVFWLPALTTQDYVSLDFISQGPFLYLNNFLFLPNLPKAELWRYLEVTSLVSGGLSFCAFLITRINSAKTFRRESNYWLAVTIVAIFMMLPLSQPIWMVLPPLQKVQFPWRFGTVLTVATTALLALGLSTQPMQFGNKGNERNLSIGYLLVGGLLLSGILLAYQKKFYTPLSSLILVFIVISLSFLLTLIKTPVTRLNKKPMIIGSLLVVSLLISGYFPIKGGLYKPGEPKTPIEVSQKLEKEIDRDAMEYRPPEVPWEVYDVSALSKIAQNYPKASVITGEGSVSVKQWKPRSIILETQGKTNLGLELKQFYYPGWAAKIKSKSNSLAVQPSPQKGLVNVKNIPSGGHEVIVMLKAGRKELLGRIISVISVLAAFVLWLGLYGFGRGSNNLNRQNGV